MRVATFVRPVLLAVLTLVVGVSTNAQNTQWLGPDGSIVEGGRCATPEMTAGEQLEVNTYLEEFLAQNPNILNLTGTYVIPIAYHVIRLDNGTRDVSDADIEEQTLVLTAAFASMDIEFETASIDRTDNTSWHNAGVGSSAEIAMTSALAVDPATTLNFYMNNAAGNLGYAYLPQSFPENSTRHGVWVLWSSMPNGSSVPYDEGDTGTHEIGHFAGLSHTFSGGCGGSGDGVPDTAPEASPAFGCPVGRDTCPGDGPDPITNFMDYVDDFCMIEFTPGQRDRVYVQMAAFRPTMWVKVPVPVELVSFNATLNGDAASFEWVTSSETNNAGFEVQMMADGQREFQAMAYVEGNGTTTEVQHYTYNVTGLNSGSHTFRLKQVDYDGAFEYSDEIEVAVGVPGTHVLEAAYPNPFNPEATFRFGVKAQQNVRAELVDVLGRVVSTLFDGNVEADEMQTIRIDGSGLPSGAYLIRVVGESFADAESVTLLK